MFKKYFCWLLSALLMLAYSTAGNAVVSSSSVISDVPLGTGTGVAIPPNIYFMFDNSGSMGWEYLPDYVNDSYCFDTGAFGDLTVNTGSPPSITGNGVKSCRFGNPQIGRAHV